MQPPQAATGRFRRRELQVGGFSIGCLEAGRGRSLIYLHGAGGLDLTEALDLLADRFHVVAFEMPGFGESPENLTTNSLADLAGTMAAAIGTLGIDRYALYGTSFGAATALWLAADHPDRISALILESPAAFRPEGFDLDSFTPDELFRALYARPERRPPQAPPDPTVIDKQLALVRRIFGPAWDDELERRLQDHRVPTLMVVGRLDGLFDPQVMVGNYERVLPHCRLALVEDAAHEIGSDQPEVFARVVGDFIAGDASW